MKITGVSISVIELPTNTPYFNLARTQRDNRQIWQQQPVGSRPDEIHVLHVQTDEGIEGICTVGDARYTTMRAIDLEHLRHLTIGEDPRDRARLNDKLSTATRHVFTMPSWYGAFDNCLWDIAGKAAQLPVYKLIGQCRERAPAYYNYRSAGTLQDALDDIQRALALGFPAIKDHLSHDLATNVEWLRAARAECGDEINIMHDAAGARYDISSAMIIGFLLHHHGYLWFEEPLPDRDFKGLRILRDTVDIPTMTSETLMHEPEICKIWLEQGACDLVRANARNGTTATLDLATHAAGRNTNIELNGPGGLFGLVHAHLTCAIENTTYYEYFPGGTRDEIGKEIGLTNPPLPVNGHITPPDAPGWGAEWDTDYFESKRIGVM